MKTFPVSVFLTHLAPHLDEIAVRWMSLQWGEPVFPGISTAEMRYLTTGVLPDEVPAEVLEEQGILPVGVGGGFLDEHPNEGGSRKWDHCAATLMSEALNLSGDEILQKIIAEIKHCDLTNLVRPTQLSSLIKLRHRRNPNDFQKVINWATKALQYLYQGRAKNIDHDTYFGQVKKYGEDLISSNKWDNERALTSLRTSLSQTEGSAHLHLTELAHIYKTINKRSRKQSREWLTEVIVDMYEDSCQFFEAVDEINRGNNVTEFRSAGNTFPVLTIDSPAKHISQAARSRFCGYVALVIQKNPKGNVAIFLNTGNEHVAREGLNLGNLIRMVRLREQSRLGHPQSQWHDVGIEGTMRRLRMWYFSKDADMILNGSTTTPDVKPTTLALPEILAIARHAFHKDMVYKWRGKHALPAIRQAGRGGFRQPIRAEPAWFQLGGSIDDVKADMPTSNEVIAELEKIMIA